MVDSYPLKWPSWIPRAKRNKRSRFNTKKSIAIQNLYYQLRLLKAKNIVITTNVETYRRRGVDIPYVNQNSDDPGVAVYFEYDNHEHCIPCDKWDVIYDNIHAIGKTVEAMRGIERWGTFEMMKATFQGFEALPPSTGKIYGVENNRVDYFKDCNTIKELRQKYRELVKILHSDKGGNDEEFTVMHQQYEKKKQELNN